MKKLFFYVLLSFFISTSFASEEFYDTYFTSKTIRVDYFHTGNSKSEIFSLDQVYEAQNWAGSRINLIDTLNLGKYFFKVFDVSSNKLLFSRGFSSIFGEWQTTGEAREGDNRTFHETVRFPFPKNSVKLVIAARDKFLNFTDKFSVEINPNSSSVNREIRAPLLKIFDVFKNGSNHKKVDLLFIGDGYTIHDINKYRNDVKNYTNAIFTTSPFKERKKEFNVRALEVISQDSGIDEPEKNVWKNTALETAYNTFGSPRYVLTLGNKKIHDLTSTAPYDFLIILLNSGRYGGGGIFQLYATSFTGSNIPGMEWQAEYVVVHEFGHSFAGLGDEYYSSAVSYEEFYPPGVEPYEPNVTALLDPNNVKWKIFVEKDTPLPTPWDKKTYDNLAAQMGKLVRDESVEYYEKRDVFLNQQIDLLKAQKFIGKVGAFEGSGYSSKGLFRPSVDCRMFSLSLADFCPVCQEAIEKMIDFYSKYE